VLLLSGIKGEGCRGQGASLPPKESAKGYEREGGLKLCGQRLIGLKSVPYQERKAVLGRTAGSPLNPWEDALHEK